MNGLPDVVELNPDDFDRTAWEWDGPDLPEGFAFDAIDEHRCMAGGHCAPSSPAPVWWQLDGWSQCWLIGGSWVVCEDCVIGFDLGELRVINGRLESVEIVKDTNNESETK